MEGRILLSDDILVNIFLYVPVISMLRFRCISKYWCAMIKSPTFQSINLKHNSKKCLLLKRYLPPKNINEYECGGDDILSFLDPHCPEQLVLPNLLVPIFEDNNARYQTSFLGPCNGLVCFVNSDFVVLCNPAMREFKLLDPTPFAVPEYHWHNTQGSGFGFDANNNDYKFIQIWTIIDEADDDYNRIDLYNLSTDSWRLIDAIVPRVYVDPGFELYFNGACHWTTEEYNESLLMSSFLSFDVSSETFQIFEYPDYTMVDSKSSSLVVFNQYLGLVRHYPAWNEKPHTVDIWIMKEYGIKESWMKELVIESSYFFEQTLLSWDDEWLLVVTSDSQLAYFAIQKNEMKRFQYYGFLDSFRALIFTESLISLTK